MLKVTERVLGQIEAEYISQRKAPKVDIKFI